MPMWISRNWSKVEPWTGECPEAHPASAQWAGCNWRWKPTCLKHRISLKKRCALATVMPYLDGGFKPFSNHIFHSFWCFFYPPRRKIQCHHLVTADGHQPRMCLFTAYNKCVRVRANFATKQKSIPAEVVLFEASDNPCWKGGRVVTSRACKRS